MKKRKDYTKNQGDMSSKALKDALGVLLIPMSIVLVGVLVSVSVLYSANVILQRDQLVTKANLQAVVSEALKNANLTAGNGGTATNAPTVTVSADQIDQVVNTQPIVLGDRNAKLKFIEFSDPSCPFCSLAAGNPDYLSSYPGYTPSIPEIEKLVKEGKASFTWIYLPTHAVGEVAAHVYYCAHEKGKFWEVHDKLLKGNSYKLVEATVQNDFSKTDILAQEIKEYVDPAFINQCVNSKKYAAQLQSDIAVATNFGANSTPAFYVGTNMVTDSDFKSFANYISLYE